MPTRLEALEMMVSKGVNDPFPMYGLALEYRSQERHDDAIRAFGQLRERFPKYVPQYLMCGQMLVNQKRPDEARVWLTQGMEAAKRAGNTHALGEIQNVLATLD